MYYNKTLNVSSLQKLGACCSDCLIQNTCFTKNINHNWQVTFLMCLLTLSHPRVPLVFYSG